jgi:hypothetical protein
LGVSFCLVRGAGGRPPSPAKAILTGAGSKALCKDFIPITARGAEFFESEPDHSCLVTDRSKSFIALEEIGGIAELVLGPVVDGVVASLEH